MKNILLVLFLFTSCTEIIKEEKPLTSVAASSDVSKPTSPEVSKPASADVSERAPKVVIPRIPLYWENTTEPHPERAIWSDILIERIDTYFSIYDEAKDMVKFCPKYSSLEKRDKLKAWGELFVAIAKHESGFNPKSQSVDVGTKDNRDTWSIGLFQMSVVDQKNYKLISRFSFDDLLKPLENIYLATAIMGLQINDQSKIVVDKSVYWAVISGKPTAKYSKIDDIVVRVRKYAKFCN